MFPEIAYLSWIDGRPERVEHDLASSDLRPPERSSEPVPARLHERDDPPADVSLESLLADVYDVSIDHVLVTAGATNANFLAFAVAASPDGGIVGLPGTDGDRSLPAALRDGKPTHDESDDDGVPEPRILVEKPGYEPMTATPRAFGGTVDRFLRPGGVLDPDRVDAAVLDETTLVAVTDRHNPTGALANRDAIAESAAVAGANGARLLVDEVYAPFTATPTDGPFGGPTTAGLEDAVVTGSLTKFFGFGDLRVGWLLAEPAFVDAAERVQRHLETVAGPSRQLARRALHNRDDLAAESRERVRRNYERLQAFVAARDELAGTAHDGSTYALLEHDRVDGDTLADEALDAGVLVVPGRFFDRPGAVRVSLGRPPDQASAALDAFADVLDAL